MSRIRRKFLERTYDVASGTLTFPSPPSKEDSTATTVVNVSWASTGIPVLVLLDTDLTGSDHTLEEAAAEGINFRAGNVVEGVSIEVIGYAPNGTNGTYKFKIVGLSV